MRANFRAAPLPRAQPPEPDRGRGRRIGSDPAAASGSSSASLMNHSGHAGAAPVITFWYVTNSLGAAKRERPAEHLEQHASEGPKIERLGGRRGAGQIVGEAQLVPAGLAENLRRDVITRPHERQLTTPTTNLRRIGGGGGVALGAGPRADPRPRRPRPRPRPRPRGREATSKSVSLTCPLWSRRMFSGFRSRWMIPLSCATTSATSNISAA